MLAVGEIVVFEILRIPSVIVRHCKVDEFFIKLCFRNYANNCYQNDAKLTENIMSLN